MRYPPYVGSSVAQHLFAQSFFFFSCLADVSARTVWTSWWAPGLLTSSKMSIPGAATFASLRSATETSNSDPTGAPKFKTSSSTTAPWSLYVPLSHPLRCTSHLCACDARHSQIRSSLLDHMKLTLENDFSINSYVL